MTGRHLVTQDEIRKGDRIEFTWDEPDRVSGMTECVLVARVDGQWPRGASRAVRLQRALPDVPREATLGWLEMKDRLPGTERRIPGIWMLESETDRVGPPEIIQHERVIFPDRVEGFTEGVLVPKAALDEFCADNPTETHVEARDKFLRALGGAR